MTTPEPKPLDATLEDHGPRSMDQGNEHWRRLLLALEQWRMQSQHPTDFENDKLRVEMVGLQNTIAALTAELAERDHLWQPIATGPRDDHCRIWIPSLGHELMGRWDAHDERWDYREESPTVYDSECMRENQPSHWRPRAKGPAALAPFSTTEQGDG